jgi:hypothetical protein
VSGRIEHRQPQLGSTLARVEHKRSGLAQSERSFRFMCLVVTSRGHPVLDMSRHNGSLERYHLASVLLSMDRTSSGVDISVQSKKLQSSAPHVRLPDTTVSAHCEWRLCRYTQFKYHATEQYLIRNPPCCGCEESPFDINERRSGYT